MRRLAALITALVLASAFSLAIACKRQETVAATKPAATASASHTDEPEHEGIPKRVHLTKKVIDDARIQTAPVAKEVLTTTLTLPGEIAVDPNRSARVSTPVSGRLVDVRFNEGATVTKGDPLATVRIPELGKVRGAFSASSAKASSARANAERLSGLAEKGLAATQEAVAAKAEADALEAEANAFREQLGALGAGGGSGSELVLRAPLSGVVVSRDAVVGQPITSEQTIGTIADLREVWFLGRVFEKDLGRLRVGAKAEIGLNAYPKDHFEGIVEYLGKQIDPVARTVTARVRLTNRDDLLRLGLFGSARISVDEGTKKAPVLVVPRTALTEIGGKSVVFVRHADDDFELHEVVLGDASLGKVEIVSGLREAEDVVVEGVFTLKSAVLKSTLAEDE